MAEIVRAFSGAMQDVHKHGVLIAQERTDGLFMILALPLVPRLFQLFPLF